MELHQNLHGLLLAVNLSPMTANGTNLAILWTYLCSAVGNFGQIFEPMESLNWPLYVSTMARESRGYVTTIHTPGLQAFVFPPTIIQYD